MKKRLKPSKPTKGKVAHAATRSVLSAIPWIGGTAVELFNAVVSPPLEKRRDEWREEIGQALQRLEREKGIDLKALGDNPAFIDTVLQATQVALRDSQEEKRRALRNAILNAALPAAPDQSLQQMFLNYIDTFTVWYLRLLKLFNDPRGWAQANNHRFPDLYSGELSTILESAYPELRGKRDLYDQVWKDLYLRGLVNTEGLYGIMTGGGLMQSRTTESGKCFLAFIEEPR